MMDKTKRILYMKVRPWLMDLIMVLSILVAVV